MSGGKLNFIVENNQTIKIWGINLMNPPTDDQFEKVTDNFYLNGEFCISIQMPKVIDPRKVKVIDHNFGILEVAVGKK